MKRIVCLLLALLCAASLATTAFAADVTNTNDSEFSAIGSEAWDCIEQKIENKKADALSTLATMPATISSGEINYLNYSSDELLDMYAYIVQQQIINNETADNLEELEAIELALNSKGTIFLTEEDMQQLFPVSGQNSTRAGEPEPGDTQNNTWSANQSLTYDGYDCVIMSAFPKTKYSSLYYREEGRDVFTAPYKDFLDAVVNHLWEDIESTIYDYAGIGKLSSLFGLADSGSNNPTSYSVDITTSMRAKFCWVYYDAFDSYMPMGTAHTIIENILHKYATPMVADVDSEETVHTRSTSNFTNAGLARKAIQQLESRGPSYPYVEYFHSSIFEYEFSDDAGLDNGEVYYIPPYAIYPSDVV